jgi:hypothetical protein
MKLSKCFSIYAAAAALLVSAPLTQAQEPVSTGVIQGLAPKAGTLTLRSDQTTRPVTFYGMDKANIFTADGKVAKIADLQPGMKATVQYAVRENRWYVSKVILAEQRNTIVTGAPVNGDPAARSKAANDGDITTQPGSKAAIDNDITTQPANRAATDGDITTQPASSTTGRAPVRQRGP